MRRVKTKAYKRRRRYLFLVAALLMVYGIARLFQQYIEPQLQAAAKQQAGIAINHIVKEVLGELAYDADTLYEIKTGEEGQVTQVSFDSKKLNELLYAALSTVDDSLRAAADGSEDPLLKDVLYEDGVIYELPLGFLSQLYFLADKGPKLPVYIRMLNDATGKIVTSVEPYGINSSMIKISLRVETQVQVITMLSVTELKNSSELPLVVQVISGEVPNVVPYAAAQGE